LKPVLRRFRGESVHKVDQKGRVSVPAPFRRVLEEGDPDWQPGQNPTLVLIYGMPGGDCLEGYSVEGANRLDEKVSRLPTFSKQRRALERLLNTQSVYAQVDENGRIVLPQKLREQFGLDAEALFAGMGEHFQVWAPEAYRADMAAIDSWRDGLGEGEDPFDMLDAMDRESPA
jgi:MraZ protein